MLDAVVSAAHPRTHNPNNLGRWSQQRKFLRTHHCWCKGEPTWPLHPTCLTQTDEELSKLTRWKPGALNFEAFLNEDETPATVNLVDCIHKDRPLASLKFCRTKCPATEVGSCKHLERDIQNAAGDQCSKIVDDQCRGIFECHRHKVCKPEHSKSKHLKHGQEHHPWTIELKCMDPNEQQKQNEASNASKLIFGFCQTDNTHARTGGYTA